MFAQPHDYLGKNPRPKLEPFQGVLLYALPVATLEPIARQAADAIELLMEGVVCLANGSGGTLRQCVWMIFIERRSEHGWRMGIRVVGRGQAITRVNRYRAPDLTCNLRLIKPMAVLKSRAK